MKHLANHIDEIILAIVVMFGMSCCTAIAVVDELNTQETQEERNTQ